MITTLGPNNDRSQLTSSGIGRLAALGVAGALLLAACSGDSTGNASPVAQLPCTCRVCRDRPCAFCEL